MLEQLAKHQAQATFFCVGDNLARHPDVARAALAAGHRLGNHTQRHQSAWATPGAAYLAGVGECQALLAASCQLLGNSHQLSSGSCQVLEEWAKADKASPGSLLTINNQPLTTNNQQLTAPRLFRPPYGRLTWPVLRALRRQQYRVIMWTLLTRDYDASLAPERALRLALAATRPGDIVVLHDSRKASRSLRYLLPRLLEHYGALGYEFAAL